MNLPGLSKPTEQIKYLITELQKQLVQQHIEQICVLKYTHLIQSSWSSSKSAVFYHSISKHFAVWRLQNLNFTMHMKQKEDQIIFNPACLQHLLFFLTLKHGTMGNISSQNRSYGSVTGIQNCPFHLKQNSWISELHSSQRKGKTQ